MCELALSVLRGEMKGDEMGRTYCMHRERALHKNCCCAVWREEEIGKDFEQCNELSGFGKKRSAG
jgi:hypothetical protein